MGEGDDNSSLEWLPAGWKMEVRVRRSGRKDKYYVDPSNDQRFCSKTEVLHYLKNVENNHKLCEESKKESSTVGYAVKFVDEEAVSEGLPAGWIKKVRVTRSSKRIRRDAYYTDPMSGHHFCSMKEVYRYLDSVKANSQSKGSCVSKPKVKEPLKSGSGDHALSLTAEPRKLRSDNNMGVQKLVSENKNLNSEIEALAINTLGLPILNSLKPCNEKEKSSESVSPVVPHLVEKIETDKKVERQEDMLTTFKKKRKGIKRETDLPRRTSKRLAGIEVELPLALEPPTQVRHAAVRPTGEDNAKSAGNCKGLHNSIEEVKRAKTGNEACKIDRIDNLMSGVDALPEMQAKQEVSDFVAKELTPKAVVDARPKEQQGVTDVLLQEHAEQGLAAVLPEQHIEQAVDDVLQNEQAEQEVADVLPEKQAKQGVTQCEGREEQETALVSTLGGLWNDPCIEFAIKTLTGDLAVGKDKKAAEISGPSLQMLDAGPSSCQDLPMGDLWADPCFEFAVKTLTGDLPAVEATRLQTVFQQQQQQHWSHKAGESN